MKNVKKLLCALTAATLFVPCYGAAALDEITPAFSDLPKESWAREAIVSASGYGLMNGVGNGLFGTGRTMTRAEFTTVLARMLGWEPSDSADAFSDISSNWARGYINSAANEGAVPRGGEFRPDDSITRKEMSVMLVRALGYEAIAEAAAGYPLPFDDVGSERGFITAAYDIGMTNGTSASTFSPDVTATREQAAAMLVRVYEKYISELSFTHAFYAISSYSQLELAKRFDAVSLGWGRMTFDGSTPSLNTTSAGGNEYCIPSGYEDAVTALQDAGVKLHLSVFMTTAEKLGELLENKSARSAAVDAIMDELSRTYPELGGNPYTGVTIDFEGLRSGQKDNFTAFLTELEERLDAKKLTLYVAVSPATADGIYYDGYDYSAIGGLADKVILMAHDYAPSDMSGFLNSTYYKTAALTPISSVHYALRAACDPATGVRDVSKITLALSFSSCAWETDNNGLLSNAHPIHPAVETVHKRIENGASMGWSATYLNPYLTYTTEDGQNIFLWYEDSRSVEAKLGLAKMFGVTGVSVWRLGLIPTCADGQHYYNVMDALK